jgi:hypothetical protein
MLDLGKMSKSTRRVIWAAPTRRTTSRPGWPRRNAVPYLRASCAGIDLELEAAEHDSRRVCPRTLGWSRYHQRCGLIRREPAGVRIPFSPRPGAHLAAGTAASNLVWIAVLPSAEVHRQALQWAERDHEGTTEHSSASKDAVVRTDGASEPAALSIGCRAKRTTGQKQVRAAPRPAPSPAWDLYVQLWTIAFFGSALMWSIRSRLGRRWAGPDELVSR